MDSLIPSTLKIDKTALSLVPCFDTSDEKLYWLSRTPSERLQHIEVLRRIKLWTSRYRPTSKSS